MPLNGTAYAGWADRFAAYAEGEEPLLLVPVGGGESVPFVHDGEEIGGEPTEAGWLESGILDVRTRTELSIGSRWTYRSDTWQVAPADVGVTRDVMAGVEWQFGARLVRHAR